MKFQTSDPTKRDQEIEKFITYLGYYPNLFESKKQVQIESHIYNYIGEIDIKNNSNYIEDELYGDAIKQENNQFRIRYATGEGRDADKFSAIHELGHILLTPIQDNNERYNESIPAQGPCKYDTHLNEFYGLGILEGTVNVLAKLSIIKQDYNDLLEEYLKNGGCNLKRNSYKPLEEIARLLVIASTPCYTEDPAIYLSNLVKNQKIDDEKSSTYLNSCLNNDFEFEKEFDRLFSNGYTFSKLCNDIDIIHKQVMNKESIDINLMRDILLKIDSYYHLKVEQEIINGRIDSDKLELLETNFDNYIEKSFNNLGIEREEKTNEI